MNEVRQLLRYTLPGIACVIELIIAFSISDFAKTQEYFITIKNNDNVGIVLGVFLGSGGLGYIFANIYFALYWCKYLMCYFAIDHCPLFTLPSIEVVDTADHPLSITDKKDAWIITAFYLFSKFPYKEDKNRINIKEIVKRADNLTTIAHGLGATLVGTVLSCIVWILSIVSQTLSFGQCVRDIIVIVMWVALLFIFYCTHYRTIKFTESLVNTAMAKMIKDDESRKDGKVQICYVK